MRAVKRFYVGHSQMVNEVITGSPQPNGRGWAKTNLKDAIAQAEQRCAETGDDQMVVQVVRIVRRATPPVRVEVVTA